VVAKNGSLSQRVLEVLNPLKETNMVESFKKVSLGKKHKIIVRGLIDQDFFFQKIASLGSNATEKFCLEKPRYDESS
jgi:hypothetical protein